MATLKSTRCGDVLSSLPALWPSSLIETLNIVFQGSKANHLRTISKKTGVQLKDMMFLDNEWGNCQTVAGIGVTVLYTPDGVFKKDLEEALKQFPAPGQVLGPKRKRGYW